MWESCEKILRETAEAAVNPRAFAEWKVYRDRLTDIVIEQSQAGSALAVYGAGRCDDIDLGRLSEHFAEITLIDLDEGAMRRALQKYGLTDCGRMKVQVFDLAGIRPEDYRTLAQAMEHALEMEAAEAVSKPEDDFSAAPTAGIGEAIETVYGKFRERGQFRAARYDVVLAAGLHSQLNRTAVSLWQGLCAEKGIFTEPAKDPVIAMIRGWTPCIIANFHELLFYSARKKAITACELGIEGRNGGIQGAMQAMDDLKRRERVRQIVLDGHEEMIWPQNAAKGVIFRMGIDTYTVR